LAGFVRGIRLGVDVGSVRVGVAVCDPDGILATPLVTLARDAKARDAQGRDTQARDSTTEADPNNTALPRDIAQLVDIVRETYVAEVVVGFPVNLAGREGPAAGHVRKYAQLLANAIAPVPVVLSDERMSTVTATRRLAERGVRGRRQRAVVDQAAAVEILQSWLDAQRRRTHD